MSPASAVILNTNGTAIEAGEDTVVMHGSSLIANIEDAFAVTGIVPSVDQGCIKDRGFGKRSLGVVVDVTIVFSCFSTITVLNGEQEYIYSSYKRGRSFGMSLSYNF
jgi:hypothetical protein